MRSDDHNSSSSSSIVVLGVSAAVLACGSGAALFDGVMSSNEAIMAPSIPGRLGLCFLKGEPTASEAPLTLLKALLSSGGVPPPVAAASRDCGVPAEGEPDFFADESETGSAECCRLSYGVLVILVLE